MSSKHNALAPILDALTIAYIDKAIRSRFSSLQWTPFVSLRNFHIFAITVPSLILGEVVPFQSKLEMESNPGQTPSIQFRRKNWRFLKSPSGWGPNKPQLTSIQMTFFWLTAVNAFDVNAQWKGIWSGKNIFVASLRVRTLVAKWVNFEFFLMNFFYFRGEFMCFGNPHLRSEIEASNWSARLLPLHAWLKFRASFSSHVVRFSDFGNFFFAKIKEAFKVVFFFSDLTFQRSNRFYFAKKFWPTIGVIDSSSHPWVFLFALPVFSNTMALQLFGLKFIMRYKRLSSMGVFQRMFRLWSHFRLEDFATRIKSL